MSDQSVAGGPPETSAEVTGPIPAVVLPGGRKPRSYVVFSLVLASLVTVLAGVVAIAVAAARPGWAVWLCVAVVAVAVVATLVAIDRTKSMTTSAPAVIPAGPQPESPVVLFGDEHQREAVFGKLSQRLQGLINRTIRDIDSLERAIEDPDLLHGLFKIDHLATQQRRQVENVAVLGGGTLQRRSETPVDVNAVLRSAVAEIEHFGQVSIVPMEDLQVDGRAVAEVIHLLAELLENATTFADPDAPKVVLRARRVKAGLWIQVQDSGLGMPWEERERINRLLDASTTIDLGELLQDGRIGLGVVKELARRYYIRIKLEENMFGGVDADVVLPQDLLVFPANASSQSPSRQAMAAPHARGAEPQHAGLAGVESALPLAPSGRHQRADASASAAQPTSTPATGVDKAPFALPVRAPGTSFSPTPVGGMPRNSAPSTDPQAPPLPQRSASPTHLPPGLRDAPSHPTVVPGHDHTLAAAARSGLALGQDDAAPPPTTDPTRTQGESPWPTT